MTAAPTSPANQPDPAPRVAQRQQIVKAATEVFREHGLVGARTREIATSAGISQNTLFRYFKSKEEIFFAAVLDPIETMVAGILAENELVADADDKTRNRTFLAEMTRHLQLVLDLTPLLNVALFSDPQLGRTFYNERLWPLLQQWIGAADVSLRGRPHRDVDALTIILTTWGMSFGMAFAAEIHGEEVDVRATARWLGDLMSIGMEAPARQRRR